MPYTQRELINYLKYEKFELSLMLVQEEEFFSDIRTKLIDEFGENSLNLAWVYNQPQAFVSKLKSGVSKKVREKLSRVLASLQRRICIEDDWCNTRHSPLLNKAEIVAAALDALQISFGVAALAVLILKNGVLDKLCHCNIAR